MKTIYSGQQGLSLENSKRSEKGLPGPLGPEVEKLEKESKMTTFLFLWGVLGSFSTLFELSGPQGRETPAFCRSFLGRGLFLTPVEGQRCPKANEPDAPQSNKVSYFSCPEAPKGRRQSRCLGWTYKLPGGQKFSIKLSPLCVRFPQRRPLNLIERPRRFLKEPPEPKTGTARTVPPPNRNRTEPNRGLLEMNFFI